MKALFYYAVWLAAVPAAWAADAESPRVSVQPVSMGVIFPGPNGQGHTFVELMFSVSDDMILSPTGQTQLRCIGRDGRDLGSESHASPVASNGSFSGNCFFYRYQCDGSSSGEEIGRMRGSVQVRAMPVFEKSPPGTLILKEGAEMRNGDATVRMMRCEVERDAAHSTYVFDAEINGSSPVAEMVFCPMERLRGLSDYKVPCIGVPERTGNGVRQVCRVRLPHDSIGRKPDQVDVVLRCFKGSEILVDVPVDERFDMRNMIAARNETDSAQLAYLSKSGVWPGSDNAKSVAMCFVVPLPKGCVPASFLSVLPSSDVYLLDAHGNKITHKSAGGMRLAGSGDPGMNDVARIHGVRAGEPGSPVICRALFFDVPCEGDVFYQGTVYLPVASGKADSPIRSIDMRQGAESRVGSYNVQVTNVVLPSADGRHKGKVEFSIPCGLVTPAGLKVRGKDGRMQAAEFAGGVSGREQFAARSVCKFHWCPESLPDQMDVVVETWVGFQMLKVPVRGKFSLKADE